MSNDLIESLNEVVDLGQTLEEIEARLAAELVEEKLKLGCWIQYSCMFF